MLDDLKEELDLETFFEAMGANKLSRTSGGYKMRCLAHNHNDSGPSFQYYVSSHKFNCYGCGFRGDIIDIVMEVKRLRFRQALSWIREFAGWSTTVTDRQLEAILERRKKNKRGEEDDISDSPVVMPAYFETDFSSAGNNVRDYLEERQWDPDLLARHGVGYCHHGFFGNRIIFPVYDRDDHLTTFAARTVDDHEDRWLYPLKSHLSRSVWPIHLPLKGYPVFVEGCPDALRLREYGYNAYAVLGNQLGEKKLNLIRKAFTGEKKLIVLPDRDNGGKILTEWFGKLVHEFDILVARFDGDDVKDVDEVGRVYGRQAVDEIIKCATPYQDIYIEENFSPVKAPDMVTSIVRYDPDAAPVVKSGSALAVMNSLYWSAR